MTNKFLKLNLDFNFNSIFNFLSTKDTLILFSVNKFIKFKLLNCSDKYKIIQIINHHYFSNFKFKFPLELFVLKNEILHKECLNTVIHQLKNNKIYINCEFIELYNNEHTTNNTEYYNNSVSFSNLYREFFTYLLFTRYIKPNINISYKSLYLNLSALNIKDNSFILKIIFDCIKLHCNDLKKISIDLSNNLLTNIDFLKEFLEHKRKLLFNENSSFLNYYYYGPNEYYLDVNLSNNKINNINFLNFIHYDEFKPIITVKTVNIFGLQLPDPTQVKSKKTIHNTNSKSVLPISLIINNTTNQDKHKLHLNILDINTSYYIKNAFNLQRLELCYIDNICDVVENLKQLAKDKVETIKGLKYLNLSNNSLNYSNTSKSCICDNIKIIVQYTKVYSLIMDNCNLGDLEIEKLSNIFNIEYEQKLIKFKISKFINKRKMTQYNIIKKLSVQNNLFTNKGLAILAEKAVSSQTLEILNISNNKNLKTIVKINDKDIDRNNNEDNDLKIGKLNKLNLIKLNEINAFNNNYNINKNYSNLSKIIFDKNFKSNNSISINKNIDSANKNYEINNTTLEDTLSYIIKKLNSLKELYISNLSLCEDKILIIQESLKQNKSIEILDLSNNNYNSKLIKCLKDGLIEFQNNLSRIFINISNITSNNNFDYFISSFFNFKNIVIGNLNLNAKDILSIASTGLNYESIDLSYNIILEESVFNMHDLIVNSYNLVSICMSNCKINNDTCNLLFKYVLNNNTLLSVDISYNDFDDEVCYELRNIFINHNCLKELNLEGCKGLTCRGMTIIFSFYEYAFKRLNNVFDGDTNSIKEYDIKKLNIIRLSLLNCSIKDLGFGYIMFYVKHLLYKYNNQKYCSSLYKLSSKSNVSTNFNSTDNNNNNNNNNFKKMFECNFINRYNNNWLIDLRNNEFSSKIFNIFIQKNISQCLTLSNIIIDYNKIKY